MASMIVVSMAHGNLTIGRVISVNLCVVRSLVVLEVMGVKILWQDSRPI
jgi:hypothetical protein